MKHTFTITDSDESLPRLFSFLVDQSRKPDDLYCWSKGGLHTDKTGITWGFDPENLADENYKVACFNEDNYVDLENAIECGALYVCSDSLDGRGQAFDACSVASMVSKCLGGNIKVVFGMKGQYQWHSTK